MSCGGSALFRATERLLHFDLDGSPLNPHAANRPREDYPVGANAWSAMSVSIGSRPREVYRMAILRLSVRYVIVSIQRCATFRTSAALCVPSMSWPASA